MIAVNSNRHITKKTEVKWITGFIATSILIVALKTDFSFGAIPLAQDPFLHLSPLRAVLYLAAFFYVMRCSLKLADLLIEGAAIFCVFFAMIIPVVILFCIYLLHERLPFMFAGAGAGIQQNQAWLLAVLILFLATMEFKMMRAAYRLLFARN
jgi:hypothetical protein